MRRLPAQLPVACCCPSWPTHAPNRPACPHPTPEHGGRPMGFFSANNTLKTYYGPLLLRPLSFLRHGPGPAARGACPHRVCVCRDIPPSTKIFAPMHECQCTMQLVPGLAAAAAKAGGWRWHCPCRGLRALFGDQTLFCRAADFR